ncbi:OST-HTH/LOTUS domain-containing protein [Microbulbifer elongatus]|uniref:OST-HTH/LOTUS domain-containing protein n=1 Tax=Microbulbifer elongatus TaxID=86173 RepID=UPI001E3ACF26|nr:OST-HTH/LOTUS domain-containing protein [Microbulbifer elongatus]
MRGIEAGESPLFLYLEKKSGEKRKNIKSDTKLITLLRQAIEATKDDDGWADLGAVGSNISNGTSFDCRNYGFKNLSSLLRAIDLFELKRSQGKSYLVRDTKRNKKS